MIMVLPLLVVLLSLLLQPHSTRALLPQQQNSCVSNSRPSYASRSTALDLYRQSGISTSGAVRSVRRSSVLFAVGRGRESSRAAGRGAGGSGRNYRPRSSIQQAKVSRILRDELSDIICSGDIKANSYPPDGLLQSVTIAEIELSGDNSLAKVYVSVFGNSVEKRQVFVWLCDNIGQVRHSLAKRLRNFKRVPEIRFSLADTQASIYLSELMEELSTNSDPSEVPDVDFEEEDDE